MAGFAKGLFWNDMILLSFWDQMYCIHDITGVEINLDFMVASRTSNNWIILVLISF